MAQRTKEDRREYKRAYRAREVIRSTWHQLRSNAKGRNIACPITYVEFEALCLRTNYHLLKGTGSEDLTLDRKKGHIGYTVENIQILKNKDNVAKENMRRVGIDWDALQSWKPVDIESF